MSLRRESGWGERRQVKLRLAPFNKGCHDFRSDGRQKDTVAKVSGGDIVAGSRGFAEDGKSVGRAGAKSGPILEDARVRQFRHECDGCLVEALHGVGISTLIETGFF